MRTSASRLLLGLLGLALARPAQAEIWYGGQLGFGLDQRNQWSAASDSSSRSLWFLGGVNLGASFFAPGTLTLGGTADYRGYRSSEGPASDGFDYNLRLNALDRTPVHLAGAISGQTIDFTNDSSRVRTGTTRADGASASTSLVFADLPVLSATFSNTTLTNRTTGAAPIKSETSALNLEASQVIDWANYRLTYDSTWASGDYAETNYRNHFVTFGTLAHLSPNVTASVNANYFLRLPTLSSALDPRIDTQNVSSLLQWGNVKETSGGCGYNYSSSLFEVPGERPRESIVHTVTAYGDRQLDPELGVTLNAGATAAQTRANGAEERATSEQVATAVRWARQWAQYQTSTSMGGGVGAFQPQTGANSVAWNVNASGGASRMISTWQVGSTLLASYDSNTGASAGKRFRLLGSATAVGAPFGWSFSSLLNLGYSHADSPTFGSRRTIDTRFTAQALRGGFALTVDAGLTDDLSDLLVPGAMPVASVAPVAFNSQSRYAMITATVSTIRQLYLSLTARHLEYTSPGRITQWETGGTLSASYLLGAFQFALSESLTTGGSGSGTSATQSLLLLTATRTFGR